MINYLNSVYKKIKKHPAKILIVLVLLLGAWLRLSYFGDYLRFNNDQARDIKVVQEMQSGNWPLLGPKAGGTTFNLGPAFYYLEFLSGLFFGFSPTGIAFFIPLLSIASIYLFYLFFRKIFSLPLALGLSLLYASSFFVIKYSRFAWNPNAIPFFLLAFFLLLSQIYNKEKLGWLDCLLLGVVTGIGVQLHTTLLILMPAMLLLTLGLMLFYKIKSDFPWTKITLLLIVIFTLNIPFVYGSLENQGENLRAFFSGAQKKTDNELSFFENLGNTATFFLQGTFYTLTGQAPKSNWLNLSKMISLRNFQELTQLCLSLVFIALGFFAFWKKFLKNKKDLLSKNFSSFLLLTFSLLSFFLFVVIGGELNIRFFIILIPIPFFLLGLIVQQFLKRNSTPKQIVAIFCFALLLGNNFFIYNKAYALENYQLPLSVYGGISQKELNSLCDSIKKISGENEARIKKFEYGRSLEYICQEKESLRISFVSESKLSQEETFFVIVNKDRKKKNIDHYKKSTRLVAEFETGRFALLVFRK